MVCNIEQLAYVESTVDRAIQARTQSMTWSMYIQYKHEQRPKNGRRRIGS